jgi:DNA modification methylase
MTSHPFKNKLNDLDSKTWLKFQKSWFIHNPPRRRKDVLLHPAKFPETLAQGFIEFFTKQGETVLDPMAGTGSTLVAALRAGRNSYGIELNPEYAAIARKILDEERLKVFSSQQQETVSILLTSQDLTSLVITGNASETTDLLKANHSPVIDYVLTSPPYWNMLHSHGAETQRKRRGVNEFDVVYSENPEDLGNISDYGEFIDRLVSIYVNMKSCLKAGAYLTIIVKNIKKGGKIYPFAWDLASRLGRTYTLKDEKIWCQDDIRLSPYGLGNAWVSNTFHHYCLQFKND